MKKLLIVTLVSLLVLPTVAQEVRFSDDFEQYAPGPLGEPWIVVVEGGTSVIVCAEAASPYEGGTQGLRFEDPARKDNKLTATIHFEPVTSGTIILEYDFRVDNPESYFGFMLRAMVEKETGGQEQWLSTHTRLGGTHRLDGPVILTLRARMVERSYLWDLVPDTWFHMKEVFQMGADTVELHLTGPDGVERVAQATSGGSHPYLDELIIGAPWPDGLGTLDVDNVRLKHLPGPTFYRPEVHGPILPSLASAPQRFEEALAKVDALTGGQASDQGLWVSSADSLTELFPDTYLTNLASQGVSLSAAQGEAESVQLLLTAVRDLERVTVRVGTFYGPGGARIASQQVKSWLVAYERSVRQSLRDRDREWWPEALMPFRSISLPAGQSRALWVTVEVPRTAAAGDYRGYATVKVRGGARIAVPLNLHVHDFALPERPALETDYWFATGAHGGYPRFFNSFDYEAFEKNCAFLERYRTSSGPTGNTLLPHMVQITRTGPDQYQFDFSGLDRHLEISFRHGTNAWNPNFSCNSGWMTHLAGGHGDDVMGIDAATGEEVVIVPATDLNADSREERHWQLVEQLQRPLVRQFWRAYVDHLKEKDWLEACNFEVMDENAATDSYVAVHRALQEIVPELRLMSYGAAPVSHPKAIGINGLWAPLLSHLDVESEALAERKAVGEKVWMYVCGGRTASSQGHSADIFMSDPPLDRRMLGWFCWEHDLDGFLFYALASWRIYQQRDPAEYDFPVLPLQFWIPDRPELASADVGRIVYPWQDPDGTWRMIPSIRIECLRDGIDDFDYFTLLKAKNPRHPLLRVPAQIINDVHVWTKDPREMLNYREALARAIEAN